ncbi:MAG: hypothetical protein EOQ33_03370 [Mesorhizobium sp.]|nr:MAG: hypothetical protein EOQ33_03370 [Mesorhizobium sp.]
MLLGGDVVDAFAALDRLEDVVRLGVRRLDFRRLDFQRFDFRRIDFRRLDFRRNNEVWRAAEILREKRRRGGGAAIAVCRGDRGRQLRSWLRRGGRLWRRGSRLRRRQLRIDLRQPLAGARGRVDLAHPVGEPDFVLQFRGFRLQPRSLLGLGLWIDPGRRRLDGVNRADHQTTSGAGPVLVQAVRLPSTPPRPTMEAPEAYRGGFQ